MKDVTVRLKPPGIGTWGVLGVDYGPGIWPQGIQMTANQAGPDTCSFSVRRDARLPWSDLIPYSAVEVEVEGSGVVWGGRVWDVQYPNAEELSVACRGHQYALEDNLMLRSWVVNGTQWWTDARATAAVSLNQAVFTSTGEVQQGGGVIQITIPAGTYGAFETFGVMLGLGATDARSISIDYVDLTNANASVQFIAQGNDDAAFTAGTTFAYGTATTLMTAPNATVSGDFSANKQYVLLALQTSAGVTLTAPCVIRLTGVRVFRDTAYRSGSASALLASTVIKDVRAALLSTVLSTDESQIATTVTTIPHLATSDLGTGGYATPRQVFQAVNAFHDYLLGVDANGRIYFQPRPTQPETEIGEWGGADFSDAGDSGEELYNRVLVQYQDGSGGQATLEATGTSPLLGLGSLTRAKVLTVNSPIDSTAATEIATKWLEARIRRPTRGSVIVRGSGGARYIKGGVAVNPADYLTMSGQMLRLTHRWDPDTGGWGRDAYITNVSYTPDGDTATLTLDSPRDRLDVVLGRYAAVRGAGLPLS